VNRKFARVIVETAGIGDYIWIHDYHLIDVASVLRDRQVDSAIGFFLHIPFPALDIFLKLPWRFQILHALLMAVAACRTGGLLWNDYLWNDHFATALMRGNGWPHSCTPTPTIRMSWCWHCRAAVCRWRSKSRRR